MKQTITNVRIKSNVLLKDKTLPCKKYIIYRRRACMIELYKNIALRQKVYRRLQKI